MKKILLMLLLCTSLIISGQEYEKRTYNATRLTVAPVINGELDDEAWLPGEWGGGFFQFEPSEGSPVKQVTEFKLLYDDHNIYVAIKAWDTAPDSIVQRMTRRDDTDGDEVIVALDSYFDQRTAFGFGVSAAGVKGDLIWTDDGMNEDETFDPIWYVKTGIFDWGWAAEMRIPLSSCVSPPRKTRCGVLRSSDRYTGIMKLTFGNPLREMPPGWFTTPGYFTG